MALCECEYCRNLFSGIEGQSICPNCSKMLDNVFAQARKYMYSTNERVTVEKLVNELDVPEKAIEYLIKQKRLVLEPRGGGSIFKCKICGKPTMAGQVLCEKCRSAVSSSMQKLEVEKEKKRRDQECRTSGQGIRPITTYGSRESPYRYRKEGNRHED